MIYNAEKIVCSILCRKIRSPKKDSYAKKKYERAFAKSKRDEQIK